MVQTEFPAVRLIANDRNSGYAEGNNLGFKSAKGEAVLTLNPDTEAVPDTFDSALRVMDCNPTYGAFGARQIATDGSTQKSVRGFPTVLGILGDILKVDWGPFGSYRLNDFDYEMEQPAPQPMGTFLLLRRKALAQIGDTESPFDESFPIFFNEVDLLYRLNRSGWPTLYSPSVRILHHGGEGTKQVRKAMIWESHRSLIRFLKKHHLKWWNAPLFAILFSLIIVGAWIRARGYSAGFGS